MSPSPVRRRRRRKGRALVAVTLLGVALAAGLLFLVVRFVSRNPERANLGRSVFTFRADRLAREIAERGPFLLQDPLGRGREVYVQHLGDDPERGWLAVAAYASRVHVDCLLRWDAGRRMFADPCTGRAYPPDGAGLTVYPATVEGGVVRIDLRAPARGS